MADTSPESVCWGKDPHPTAQAASVAARNARARLGGRWSGYRCPYCGEHHIGHEKRLKGDRKSRARVLSYR